MPSYWFLKFARKAYFLTSWDHCSVFPIHAPWGKTVSQALLRQTHCVRTVAQQHDTHMSVTSYSILSKSIIIVWKTWKLCIFLFFKKGETEKATNSAELTPMWLSRRLGNLNFYIKSQPCRLRQCTIYLWLYHKSKNGGKVHKHIALSLMAR